MGVNGFIKIIKLAPRCITKRRFKYYHGCKIGIDASQTLYKFCKALTNTEHYKNKDGEITGKLFLSIPDLEVILMKLLDPSIPDSYREWLMYTLFGVQTNPANRDESILDYPLDLGQFHTCGFTEKTITQELTKNGFLIDEIFKFDGWGTPSLWVKATIL